MAPVEGSHDHFVVVDHGTLVVMLVDIPVLDWFLRDAQVSKAKVQAVLIPWPG